MPSTCGFGLLEVPSTPSKIYLLTSLDHNTISCFCDDSEGNSVVHRCRNRDAFFSQPFDGFGAGHINKVQGVA